VIVDHGLALARRKLNRPDAVTRMWECIGEPVTVGVRYTLADPVTFTNREDVLLDIRDMDAEPFRFEAETGKCADCGGDGQEWRGWSHIGGHKWRPCKRCGATGAAPAIDPPLPGDEGMGRT